MQSVNTPNTDTDLHSLAKKRVEMKMAFLVHLMVFVAVNSGLYLLSAVKGGGSWQVFPLWGWGLGLAIHGLVTLLSLQGQGLRERLMDAELEALQAQRAGR
jgi:steroid 5-alpha reductase family enzyme